MQYRIRSHQNYSKIATGAHKLRMRKDLKAPLKMKSHFSSKPDSSASNDDEKSEAISALDELRSSVVSSDFPTDPQRLRDWINNLNLFLYLSLKHIGNSVLENFHDLLGPPNKILTEHQQSMMSLKKGRVAFPPK